MLPPDLSIAHHFSDLPDPRRVPGRTLHKFHDLLTIAICSVACGMDAFTDMEDYGNAKRDWLETFLELPAGIPSHDTFRNVLEALDPDAFRLAFMDWMQNVQGATQGEIVALDGKTLRRSFDQGDKQSAFHLVCAWAVQNGVALGQQSAGGPDKSGELGAMHKLLDLLSLKGALVTCDALGTNIKTAQKILDQGADYVLCVKANQPKLKKEVEDFVLQAEQGLFDEVPQFRCAAIETEDHKHGRDERRNYRIFNSAGMLQAAEKWRGLKSVVCVDRQRTLKGKKEATRHWYISSLENEPDRLAQGIRLHWGIENGLHWVLDVTFREDDSRIRAGHGAENVALIRRLVTSLHKSQNNLRNKNRKLSMRRSMNKATMDDQYLAQVLLTKIEEG